MDYDNTNTMIVFENDKKGNDKAPDFKGKINCDGVDKEVALWFGETKTGNKMLKGKLQEPFKKNNVKPSEPVETQESFAEEFDDSIPF